MVSLYSADISDIAQPVKKEKKTKAKKNAPKKDVTEEIEIDIGRSQDHVSGKETSHGTVGKDDEPPAVKEGTAAPTKKTS